jgi:hypothetical protein
MRLIHSDTTESKLVVRKRPMNRLCNGATQKVWMHIWAGVYRMNKLDMGPEWWTMAEGQVRER